MTESTSNHNPGGEPAASACPATSQPTINWEDPNVPAGNAPPMSRFPLIASAVVFGLWIAFLVAMAFVRLKTVSQ